LAVIRAVSNENRGKVMGRPSDNSFPSLQINGTFIRSHVLLLSLVRICSPCGRWKSQLAAERMIGRSDGPFPPSFLGILISISMGSALVPSMSPRHRAQLEGQTDNPFLESKSCRTQKSELTISKSVKSILLLRLRMQLDAPCSCYRVLSRVI
jgi:hypothetical protein